jgi:GNAT superfamily N-acetyltransferase
LEEKEMNIENNLYIREATSKDIDAIQYIHRDCNDPWHDIVQCKAWVENRLFRNFYIQVAEIEGRVIGHGEWVVSEEPMDKFVYLGLLQVDSEFQGLGVGRAMLEDGAVYTKKHHCSKIVTIPEQDTTSIVFYEKCGFVRGRRIYVSVLPTYDFRSNLGFVYENVPECVIKEKQFVFGAAQVSSRHMWEVLNRKPSTDDRMTPAVVLPDGSWIQLSYFDGQDTGFAMYWSNSPENDAVKSVLQLGFDNGLKCIEFRIFDDYLALFEGGGAVESDIELYKAV